MRKDICILVLVFSLLAGFSWTRESHSSGLAAKEAKAGFEKIELGSVRQNPEEFRHRKVIVTGEFLGWQGEAVHPGITRSDWIVKDASGAIYVTGALPYALDPVKDRGRRITVLGTIELNKKGVPYLIPDKVEIGEGR